MSIIIGGPGNEPGDNNPTLPAEQIESVFTIDGGWLVILVDGTLFTTDNDSDFSGFNGAIEPLPEPIEIDLPTPGVTAIGGEIGGSPVGVVVIT